MKKVSSSSLSSNTNSINCSNFDDIHKTLYHIKIVWLCPRTYFRDTFELNTTTKTRSGLLDYINVLKPRETSLLVYIGVCTSIIAAGSIKGGFRISDILLTLIALTLGSAGVNGLTNYLDRDVDARMKRTCGRALPSRLIEPAHKVIPLIVILIVAGLVLAWIIYPVCFLIGLIGIIASGAWRKTISCTYLGIIAGSAPVLIGWYAITKQPVIDIQAILFFCLIAFWTPLHVWTVMLANRLDYESAGLKYFPLSWKDKDVIRLLSVLSLALFVISLLVYFLTGLFGWMYLVVAVLMGILMIYANIRLMISPTSKNSWRVYKLSAFPYLGIIFTVMAIDIWLK